MSEIEIRGRVLPLLFNTKAFAAIEREVCLFKDFLENLNGNNGTDIMIRSIRVMGNEALEAEGKKAVLTNEWLYKNINPAQIGKAKMAVIEAIAAGMKAEHDDDKDSGPRDLVLEELNKKKEPDT